jgi:hypothetical protein
MADRQITCAIKAQRFLHASDTYITHIGGAWGTVTEEQAIADIDSHTHSYCALAEGRRVYIHPHQGRQRRFLKTDADGYVPNSLLSLPDRRRLAKALSLIPADVRRLVACHQ